MKESAMVLESARRHLNELLPLAQELNAASTRFTEELRIIEAELVKLNLGVEVTLPKPLVVGDGQEREHDDGEPAGTYREVTYLCFGRHGRRWAIVARCFRLEEGVDSVLVSETPLLEASREERIAAAEQIEDLLKLIASTAKEKIVSLNKVIDESPIPPAWNNFLRGTDESGLVHVLKNDGSGDGLCGARPITTNDLHGIKPRPCPKCVSVTRLSAGGRQAARA